MIGICQRALKANGYKQEANELANRVTNSHSYDEALQIITEFVNPISNDDCGFEEDYEKSEEMIICH